MKTLGNIARTWSPHHGHHQGHSLDDLQISSALKRNLIIAFEYPIANYTMAFC